MPIPNHNPILTNPNQITVIYAVQLPSMFQKLIVIFRRVPWIILFYYLME